MTTVNYYTAIVKERIAEEFDIRKQRLDILQKSKWKWKGLPTLFILTRERCIDLNGMEKNLTSWYPKMSSSYFVKC